jgi:2'-hydroxyisoflavone reductase
MKILVIGGTSFVGRHIVEAAAGNGHEVVLFNRGISNPEVFPHLRRITGDRRKDAGNLSGQVWDAVIDTCAYSPADLAPVIKNVETGIYVLVSTISVYSNYKNGAPNENSAVLNLELNSDEVTGESYGSLKVQTEEMLIGAFGNRALIIRPSIVAGPYDPTDRFTFWVCKLAESGNVLVPGSKKRKVQWIDARDLASFVIRQIEEQANGVFNVAADAVSMEDFIAAVGIGEAKVNWVDDAFLLSEGIQPFEIPLWIPISEEHPEGFIIVQNSKAKKAGLQCRTARETAGDIRSWLHSQGERPLKAGINREKELKLLARYKALKTD